MLYLQLPADAASLAPPERLLIEDSTARAFERALLAADAAERLRELTAAFADRSAATWALALSENRLKRTVNRVEQAAEWLSGAGLAVELADALHTDAQAAQPNEIDWRLPRLAASLAAASRAAAHFERRLEHEKLESLKELAYGASHEINNPLANIAARAQTLLEDEADSERQRKLIAIHRQAMRAHEMISDLMLFARPPKLKPAPCRLGPLVERVAAEFRDLADEQGVELTTTNSAERIEVLADETQLAVAVGALVKNAIEAVGEGGHVNITVQVLPHGDPPTVEISVSDDGPGIPDEVRRHMFDPFYSGREAGRGLGFGASECWRIVTDHGGRVEVKNRTAGAEIAIYLLLL
jgi:signal transduction histidine kinase